MDTGQHSGGFRWLMSWPDQDPRIDWEFTAAAAFSSFLVLAALNALTNRVIFVTVAMVGVLVALCWWSTVRGGFAVALLFAMFHIGFVGDHEGRLVVHSAAELALVLSVAALVVALTGGRALHIRVRDAEVSPRRSGPAPAPSPADGGGNGASRRMRTALLNAVSQDLRTPLASAKVAVSSLLDADVDWSSDERAELLVTADESLDRLTRLVANLLDMSQLEAGVLIPSVRPVDLEEIVPQVLHDLGGAAAMVHARDMTDVPPVLVDPGLLERIVANLVVNACRHSPPFTGPVLATRTLNDRVELRIIDRGPGIAAADRDEVFRPFQRRGDRSEVAGIGLGLALSRGLVQAMGGSLEPEETPGGGLTMVITLPAAVNG